MDRRKHFLILLLMLIATCSFAHAQKTLPAKGQPPRNSNADKEKAAREEAKRLEEQRRATATALLISVADEARSYRNQTLRARIQARAADILWEIENDRARSLFRRAWEAAEVADAENQRRFNEERQSRLQEGKSLSIVSPPGLRIEVLRMAAKRDRKLGEEFLAKLDEARKQDASVAPTQSGEASGDSDPFELPSALKLRLRLAQQLLETDIARAIEFADPALTQVSVEGLVFLCYLREKSALAADQRYANMLGIAGADQASDANSISLLSSYLFTPFTFVRISSSGGTNRNQYNQASPPPGVSAELRAAFFRVAESVFLRPLAPPDQDRTTSGRIGKFLIMSRLLPYFEQYAPEQSTTMMKAQIAALAREVPDDYKRRGQPQSVSNQGNAADDDEDSIDAILNRVELAANQEERDALYAQAAIAASEKGDARTFDLTDKIDDNETRKSVRAYVDFIALRKAVDAKKTAEALKLARSGSLSSLQRVWALTLIARLLVRTDREKAIELNEEAAAEARRISGSSADKPRALVGVSTAMYVASRGTAWELMSEAIRSANNSVEEFTGEDAHIVISIHTKNQSSTLSFTVDEFDLTEIYRSFAKEDLQRAILLAKDFNGESPRATAIIAIVRAVLESKAGSGSGK